MRRTIDNLETNFNERLAQLQEKLAQSMTSSNLLQVENTEIKERFRQLRDECEKGQRYY
ncbi:hypothetical protein BKA69DRAFT_1048609 [Paraphysoderma sedebokerense]|nr:hypothetical protein BKA69DRAFT_1048609 [Paraphysoderma sedebokerense]